MGLPAAVYQFSSAAPSLHDIYRAICEINQQSIPMTIRRHQEPPGMKLSPEQRAYIEAIQARHREKQERRERATGRKYRSTPLADESMELRIDSFSLDIHPSRDGLEILVVGGNAKLFDSAFAALESLGGVKKVRTKTA